MRDLESALSELPAIDIHTHLVGSRLGARGLHDILLYHMVISDLYAAGCPNGARLTQFPEWPATEEAHAPIEQALTFLPPIRNTSSFGGVKWQCLFNASVGFLGGWPFRKLRQPSAV